jgi:hypothetical protein
MVSCSPPWEFPQDHPAVSRRATYRRAACHCLGYGGVAFSIDLLLNAAVDNLAFLLVTHSHCHVINFLQKIKSKDGGCELKMRVIHPGW